MEKKSSTGAIIAIVGGVVLAVGSFLTWVSVSVDVPALGKALGIDLTQAPGFSADQFSKSFTGYSASDGKITLVCGVLALVFAGIALGVPKLSKLWGGLTAAAGLVGGGVALYDITQKASQVADAKASAAPALTAAGVDPSILDNVFNVSFGIGIYLCVIGGLIAVIGGIMLLMRKSGPAAASMGEMGSAVAMDTAAPATPAAPPTPPTPAPPVTEASVGQGEASADQAAAGSGQAPPA